MNSRSDQDLLLAYVQGRNDGAFGELVRRHIDLVYSAALRRLHDPHLAQDITQGVFVALAQSAAQLTNRPVLSGWLHRTTQNLSANAIRSNARRRSREQEAAAMNEQICAEPEAGWEDIAPYLDGALSELSEPDRDALLLRYFERKTAREIAQTLGISEEAAQKRVRRALERLRDFLAKSGVTVGATGLCALVSANAVQAAPAGLAITILSSLAQTGTAVSAVAGSSAAKTLAMTTLQKILVAATLATAIGIAGYEARRASVLHAQVDAIRQQQATQTESSKETLRVSLQGEIDALETRNLQLAGDLAGSTAETIRLQKEREQARHSASLFRELAYKANSQAGISTNEFPTPRHVWVAWGRLGRLSVQLTQDQNSLSGKEKATADASQFGLAEEFMKLAKVMKQLESAKPSGEDSPEERVDNIACLLYGALNLDEQQFNQVFALAEKYRALAKEKGLPNENTTPEATDARQRMTEQLIAEFQGMLTPEQASIFGGIRPHLQLEPGKFGFNFSF